MVHKALGILALHVKLAERRQIDQPNSVQYHFHLAPNRLKPVRTAETWPESRLVARQREPVRLLPTWTQETVNKDVREFVLILQLQYQLFQTLEISTLLPKQRNV